MPIQVTGCRLLVKPLNVDDLDPTYKRAKSAGIVLTDKDERTIEAHAEKGVLLQIGPKASEEYMEGAKVGDVIGFTKFGGKFVKENEDDQEKFLIINDEDVICIFKE